MTKVHSRRSGLSWGVKSLFILGALVLLPAAPVWGGFAVNLNRPDIDDISQSFVDVADSLDMAFIHVAHTASQPGGLQNASVFANTAALTTTSAGQVILFWFIFEPDKVTRKAHGAKLKQGDHVGFAAYANTLFTSFFAAPATVADCKAQMSAKTAPLKGKWKMQCASNILDSLGLTAPQKNAFMRAFGTTTFTEISGQNP